MFSIFYAQWIQYIVWGKKQNTPRVALTDNYPSEINILLWQNMKCFSFWKTKNMKNNSKISHCRNNSKISHCRNNSKISHCRNSKISHCRNNSKISHRRNNSKISHCRNNSQKQTSKSQKEAKSIFLSHKYMTAYFPGLAQALQ